MFLLMKVFVLTNLTAAAAKRKCMAPGHNFIENTIREQWIAVVMPPEPCSARRAEAASLSVGPNQLNSIDPEADKNRRGFWTKARI
jgi:hypothetical protein